MDKKRKEESDLLGFTVVTNEHGLNEREEAFVHHYIREVNATLAAKLAGYSHQTAGEIGYALLRKVQIMQRIQALRTSSDKKYDGLREKIINKLMIMADLDVASLYDEAGNLKPVHEWDLDARTSVQGIDTTHDLLGFNTTKKVKLSERTKALDMLIKMQGYNAPEKVMPTDADGNYTPAVININVVPPQKEAG